MRRAILETFAAVLPAILSSCATAPAPAPGGAELTRLGEAVQLAESSTSVQECEFITDLSPPSTVSDEGITVLRNQAGSLGANTVLLITAPGGAISRAEGYLCAD